MVYIVYFCGGSITAPPKIDYDAKYRDEVKLNAGGNLIIPVTISGLPKPTVSWFHDDKALSPGNGTTIESTDTSSKLTVKEISSNQSGTYSVKAENTAGSAQAHFTVILKGKIFALGLLITIALLMCSFVLISVLFFSFDLCIFGMERSFRHGS